MLNICASGQDDLRTRQTATRARGRTTLTIDDLLQTEAIRKLRVRYSYYLDAGELDDLVSLFTDDAICEFGPFGVWQGREAIAKNFEEVLRPILAKGGFQSLHVNTNHWVELLDLESALGRVYLVDLACNGGLEKNPLIWLGVYDEAYRKVGGDWKIERSSLQFMWPQRHLTSGFPGKPLPMKP